MFMSKILSYFSIKTMVISAVVTLSGRPLSKTRKSSSCFLTYVEVFGNLEGWFFPWFYFKIMSKNFEESFLNIFHLLIACTDSYSNIFFFLWESSVFLRPLLQWWFVLTFASSAALPFVKKFLALTFYATCFMTIGAFGTIICMFSLKLCGATF